MLVILALGLPLFTSAALLLFHTSNDPMKVLIAIIFFHSTSVFLVMFPAIFSVTLLAPNAQPVLAGTILTELTLVFPLFAFGASLHLSHSPSVSHSRPPLLTKLVGSFV